jgi:hypothetical protein
MVLIQQSFKLGKPVETRFYLIPMIISQAVDVPVHGVQSVILTPGHSSSWETITFKVSENNIDSSSNNNNKLKIIHKCFRSLAW